MIKLSPKTLPKPLKHGDEVHIVATSSALEDKHLLKEGIQIFEEWGLICREQKILGRYWQGLAGDDLVRRQELQPKIAAPLIACARGGWGAARLLEFPQKWQIFPKKGLL